MAKVTDGKYEIEISLWVYNGEKTIASSRALLNFNHDGARYHVWLALKTGAVQDTLYKKCPEGLGRDDPGYFDTRKLNSFSAASKRLIEAAQVQAGDYRVAYAEAYAAGEAKLLAEQAAAAEAVRIERIQKAGPALLETVLALKAHIDGLKWGQPFPGRPHAIMDAAEAAIALAGGDRAADPWRDMETEPKKGMYLITNAKGEVCPIQWDHGAHHGIVQNCVGFNDWTYGEPATGWMPMPAPRKAVKS